MEIHRFDLDGSGLTRVLGELQARIMEAVWHLGAPTIREICTVLGPEAHHKTVMTVTNRLVDKGFLVRERTTDRAYVYRATVERDALLAQVAANVTSELLTEFGQGVLAHLVNAAEEVDPAYLDELERLVRERKGGRR